MSAAACDIFYLTTMHIYHLTKMYMLCLTNMQFDFHISCALHDIVLLCCAAVASTCGVNGTDCSLQVYVGASGDDRYGVAFNSGWMIQQINRFSVASLYDNSKMQVSYQIDVVVVPVMLPHAFSHH